jgi:hypothetical protein
MRRSLFFLIAAIAALAMVPVIESHLAYVPKTISATYVVLAAVTALDAWSRKRF